MVEGYVVQMGVLAIVLVEFHRDHRAALVPGNQRTDEAALGSGIGDLRDDPVIQVLGRNRSGYQRISTKTFLGDFVDEGVGRPQGAHAAARYSREEGHRLGDVIQPLQARGAPDIALSGLDHDGQSVRPQQVIAVGLECLDVFVAYRQLLFEAGIHAQLYGEPAHDQREYRQARQHQPAMPEQHTFDI